MNYQNFRDFLTNEYGETANKYETVQAIIEWSFNWQKTQQNPDFKTVFEYMNDEIHNLMKKNIYIPYYQQLVAYAKNQRNMSESKKILRKHIRNIIQEQEEDVDAEIKNKKDSISDLESDKKSAVAMKNAIPSSKKDAKEREEDSAQKNFLTKKINNIDDKIKKGKEDVKTIETKKQDITTKTTTKDGERVETDVEAQFNKQVDKILNRPV